MRHHILRKILMFGYLTVAGDLLTEEEYSRYRACYCGLCRSIKEKYGQLARFALTYDMTFLVLFLNALYEPDERSGNEVCAAHPFRSRPWIRTSYTDYAADMTMILAFLKMRDDWKDNGNVAAVSTMGFLNKAWRTAKKEHGELVSGIEEAMQDLAAIEKSGQYLPDEASDCFGNVMAAIFSVRDDRWTPVVRKFAYSLGKYIYILDAVEDLEKDRLYGRYNPFLPMYGKTDNPAMFRSILTVLLSDCLRQYDVLPIVQDSSLLKNILCVGLWSGFVKKYGAEEGPFDVSGSL